MSPLTKAWLGLIARTLNRLTRRLARAGVGPFWIVRHVGRKSGRTFETPIIVARERGGDGYVIELTYGPEVQWHRNLVAAGGAVLRRGERRIEVGAPERITAEEGRAAFSPAQQRILRLTGRQHFELLRPTGRTWSAGRRSGPPHVGDPLRNDDQTPK